MTTVLPCPFCGHDNVEIDEVGIGEYAVDCPECRAIGPIASDVMSAIAKYNGALQRMNNVSVTPAGGGDISPAAANRSTSLAKNPGEVAAVVEPPRQASAPAGAGADEIDLNHSFHAFDRALAAGDNEPPALRFSIDSQGHFSIERDGKTIITLDQGNTASLGLFMEGTSSLWESA